MTIPRQSNRSQAHRATSSTIKENKKIKKNRRIPGQVPAQKKMSTSLAWSTAVDALEEAKLKQRPALLRILTELEVPPLSSTDWSALQETEKGKWPQPEAVVRADADSRTARIKTCYLDETYMTITRWTENTEIQYRPHAKRPGTKSFFRYERYMHARTVGESLVLGSYPADWCWDWERGFIRVVGGPIREEPLDPSKISIQDLSAVDKILQAWFKRELARQLGVSLKEVGGDKSWCESVVMRMRRSVSERIANEVLEECSRVSRMVTEADVLKVLQSWAFRKNETRLNVMPEGVKFVSSDTIGLIPSRDGRILVTPYTVDFPATVKVLTRYLADHLPAEFGVNGFPFTSINVNKNYSAKLHRDGNNVGPSVIKAFGDFEGGLLHYFPNDDRSTDLESLPSSDDTALDLTENLVLFDGRRGHYVEPFVGERYSLVYFTCARCEKAEPDVKQQLIDRGISFPTQKQTELSLRLLAPPNGYKNKHPSYRQGSQFKKWPVASFNKQKF